MTCFSIKQLLMASQNYGSARERTDNNNEDQSDIVSVLTFIIVL